MGEKQKALQLLNQALPIARAAGSRDAEAGPLNDIGAIYNSLGEYQKALDPLCRALELYRGTGTPGNEADALSNIARSQRGLGNLAQARSNSELALKIVESQRAKVASYESRASYFESVGRLYDLDIDLLMQMHEKDSSKGFDAIAVETGERARARSLLDLLEHEHVLLVPGSSFNVPYRNRFRVTLLPDAAMLREAFVRIGRALDRAADRAGVSRHVAVA